MDLSREKKFLFCVCVDSSVLLIVGLYGLYKRIKLKIRLLIKKTESERMGQRHYYMIMYICCL